MVHKNHFQHVQATPDLGFSQGVRWAVYTRKRVLTEPGPSRAGPRQVLKARPYVPVAPVYDPVKCIIKGYTPSRGASEAYMLQVPWLPPTHPPTHNYSWHASRDAGRHGNVVKPIEHPAVRAQTSMGSVPAVPASRGRVRRCRNRRIPVRNRRIPVDLRRGHGVLRLLKLLLVALAH